MLHVPAEPQSPVDAAYSHIVGYAYDLPSAIRSHLSIYFADAPISLVDLSFETGFPNFGVRVWPFAALHPVLSALLNSSHPDSHCPICNPFTFKADGIGVVTLGLRVEGVF